MLGLRWMQVKLLPHDDEWDEEFLRTKAEIASILGDSMLQIEHVGSTAIKDIYAKPIIDAAVVVKSFSGMNIEGMKAAGYRYMGARNVEADRHMFAKYAENSEEIVTHHIHIYEPENENYKNQLIFRDYLNTDSEAANVYNEIKMKAANANPDDRYAYSDAKREFIERTIEAVKRGTSR